MTSESRRPEKPDYRLLFEASPHPYLILRADPTFTIVAVNDRYLEVTGTDRSDVLGRGVFEVFPQNPYDSSDTGVDDLRISLERVLRDRGQDIMGVQKYDIPRRDTSGGFVVKYWSPVNTPVFDEDGSITFIIHHVEDITEFVVVREHAQRENTKRIEGAQASAARMEAEVMRRVADVKDANRRLKATMEELERREAELERSNRELDEFAYIASHDLKEPLRGINNYASFLREDYSHLLDEEGKNYLERMGKLTERMSALIDHILAYSRLGRSELSMERVDVDALLNRVAEDLKTLLENHGVELRRSGPFPAIQADPVRMGEVFQNLIANAVKYNDKPQRWVEVGSNGNEAHPVFYVRDNGIGIPPQHQESVFKMFKRLHEQNKYGGGTGAGLAIVKKIVERHGGRIWLDSVPGIGTTFYFTLGTRMSLGSAGA